MILAPFYPLHLTKSQVLCKTGSEPVGLIHILAFHPISALRRGATCQLSSALSCDGFNSPFGLLTWGGLALATQTAFSQKEIYF